MKTEIFIEGQPLDLMDNLPTEFTYAIDDIQDFGSKNTSFSKTLNIAGSANNNQIFGFVFDLGNANLTNDATPNVGYNFNATKAAQCRIFVDGIQVFKGILRLLEMVRTGEVIEYQCSVFGELGGFITALANKKLEELDFSAYDKAWSYTNITNSWNTIAGSNVYFPLVDTGQVSTDKISFDFKAFKPALFVREYLEKIITASGYTWDFPLLTTALMNRLVIPNNQSVVTKLSNNIGDYRPTNGTYNSITRVPLTTILAGNFTKTGGDTLEYTAAGSIVTNIKWQVGGTFNTTTSVPVTVDVTLWKNATILSNKSFNVTSNPQSFIVNVNLSNITISNGDDIYIGISTNVTQIRISTGALLFTTEASTRVPIGYAETLIINDTLPLGIFQRDFFLSICKMFNLYVYEDQWDSKKIIIKPYIDFYDGSFIDWSNKIDRSKPIGIKPMSEINARYYAFKYKSDNDFYNDNYKKKFNEGYADRLYDTEFDFVKDTDSTEVIFASSPLYQKTGTDKIYPAIYKLSDNNTKEDRMDFVIRILQAKKITGRTSWTITNGASLGSQTTYGYAGHLDDPFTPTNDINFGAPKELYFSASTYPTTNLFNAYYSDYMAEITDKDSKLLKCEALLNIADIQNLDFSKLIMIDNQLFRLNKIDGYSIIDYKTSKVELLKVITKVF
jgi:hypothetical protein